MDLLVLQMQQKLYVASTSGHVTALEIKVLRAHITLKEKKKKKEKENIMIPFPVSDFHLDNQI